MRRRRLLWHLLPSYLLVALVTLLAVGWFAYSTFNASLREQALGDLAAKARLVEQRVRDKLAPAEREALARECRALAGTTGSRLTIILLDGEVLWDTHENARQMENHADRLEVAEALAGCPGEAIRASATLGTRMLYSAVPVEQDGEVIGCARVSQRAAGLEGSLANLQLKILAVGLFTAGLALCVGVAVARRIVRPLEDIAQSAKHLGRGELNHRLLPPDIGEMAELVARLNKMSRKLDKRLRTVTRQCHQQDAVLASMVESVIAVDTNLKVISMNRAGAQLLGLNADATPGRDLQTVVHNVDLRQFIADALVRQQPIERDLILDAEDNRVLQAHGTALRDADGNSIGAVVVLNDVSRLRRLETVRQDFVANVSHELKTPITSIKGFVETLLDGALENRADAERFLHIVAKQADRLNAIIEDLLSLSKIEQSDTVNEIELVEERIRPLLDAALLSCANKAEQRGVEVHLQCDDTLRAAVNAPLLEQAIVNLLDNAIKYSDAGDVVEIVAASADSQLSITVRDEGCGIEPEHLPRLFERFYRVDKARSRKLGGTGLGLAIVKHIVNTHGGRVTVTSEPGAGSTFHIHLPAGRSEVAVTNGKLRPASSPG